MDFLVCAYGEPSEGQYMRLLQDYVAGYEFQNCERKGTVSETEWANMITQHQILIPKIAGRLALHGPFTGIYYGYKDHLLRDAVRKRMDMTFEAACRLEIDTLVLHSGCSGTLMMFNMTDLWLKDAKKFWQDEIKRYAERNIRVVLENVCEPTPEALIELTDHVNNEYFGLCFDIGHAHLCSSITPAQWTQQMGERLKHIHLHDNNGHDDQHLPVGQGSIDFDSFFEALYQYAPHATVSLEILAEPQKVVENVTYVVEHYGKNS